MSTPYNPFEPLDSLLVKEIIKTGNYFVVIQNFNWPGVPERNGFIVIPYKAEASARQHIEKLTSKEGFLINLQSEPEKMTALLKHPQYQLFLNTFRDVEWASLVLKHYQNNIVSYLKENTTIPLTAKIRIDIAFKYGRLKAFVQSDEQRSEFDAYELVK